MSRKCDLSGARPDFGRQLSHSNRRSGRVRYPNLQRRRIYDLESGRWVRVQVSARTLKTITRKGLSRYLRDRGLKLRDVT